MLPEGFCQFGVEFQQVKWRGRGGVPNPGPLTLRGKRWGTAQPGDISCHPGSPGSSQVCFLSPGGSSAPGKVDEVALQGSFSSCLQARK